VQAGNKDIDQKGKWAFDKDLRTSEERAKTKEDAHQKFG